MKKFLFCLAALTAATAMAATSQIPSQLIFGEFATSISPNGHWMVSDMDMEKSMIIRNVETGETWYYLFDGSDFGDHWDSAITNGATNDGTVVGEYNDVPSYWRNGVWTPLEGPTGEGAAVVGAITPDGSMIVGGFSDVSLSLEDRQMTYPCIWYRNPDGTYGKPVFLPNPDGDLFNLTPQYLHATAVSADGNTIGAIMTSNSGFNHFPYVFTKGTDGEWTCRMLGLDLVNPNGLEVPDYPGDYEGPMFPSYEDYMTPEELAAFFAAGDEWIEDLYNQGITDETEITLLEFVFAMDFMSEENRALYEPLLNAFLEAYVPWWEKFQLYVEFMEALAIDGYDFMYNNILVSPDGKYLYASATRNGMAYHPVRFDVATGEAVRYNSSFNFVLTGVTEDYSVFASQNGSYDGRAYIFPQNSTTPVDIIEYWKETGNMDAYDWMEENLYRQVVTGLTPTGSYIIDDRWTVGKPVVTPDMSLIAFAVSTESWYPAPDDGSFVATALLNPFYDSDEVETIMADGNVSVTPLAGGILLLKGEVKTVTIYDLSGCPVFTSSNPSETISTGLSAGLYIVTATTPAGSSITTKIRF